MGKEREGETNRMGKAAAATQPEPPGSQTQGNGDRDMLAESPTSSSTMQVAVVLSNTM